MCLILDIVLNHIRPVHSLADLQKVKPFNDISYLHLLNMSGMSFDKQLDDNWKCVAEFCKMDSFCGLKVKWYWTTWYWNIETHAPSIVLVSDMYYLYDGLAEHSCCLDILCPLYTECINLPFERQSSRYAEKGENWPFPIQALGPGAQCQMNRFENGSSDGTNSGTYCNNYPGNNYSKDLGMGLETLVNWHFPEHIWCTSFKAFRED